jgi:hypothetical protein
MKLCTGRNRWQIAVQMVYSPKKVCSISEIPVEYSTGDLTALHP